MEQQNMQDRAGYYLDTLNRVREQVQDEETARAILQEIGKDGRVEKMRAGNGSVDGNNFGGNSSQGEQPATTKQLGYLRALNVEIPKGLTKQEASELIDENAG